MEAKSSSSAGYVCVNTWSPLAPGGGMVQHEMVFHFSMNDKKDLFKATQEYKKDTKLRFSHILVTL